MQWYYTPKDVRRLVGITNRQMKYWADKKIVHPRLSSCRSTRFYTLPDIITMAAMAGMRETGLSVQEMCEPARKFRKRLDRISKESVAHLDVSYRGSFRALQSDNPNARSGMFLFSVATLIARAAAVEQPAA